MTTPAIPLLAMNGRADTKPRRKAIAVNGDVDEIAILMAMPIR
jgi:hypothetical protein